MSHSKAYDYFNKLSPQTKDLITATTDNEFNEAFDRWLNEALIYLEKSKKNLQPLGEDGLSDVLVGTLNTPEISVTREQFSNGHVDITVKIIAASPHRVKLGEAKKWDGNKYHIKGLDQLLNRYTVGREDRGFVISYVKLKDIKGLFEKLREYIDESKPFALEGKCKDNGIRWSFLSAHKHNSGELIEICHVGCNLFIEA